MIPLKRLSRIQSMDPGDLSNLPEDEKVFIDTNILTYNLLKDSVYGHECNRFINKI